MIHRIAEPFARNVARQISSSQFALVRVTSRYAQTAPESKELVERIRAIPIGAGLTFLVGGGTAGVVDYASGLYGDFPRVLVFIVLSTYLILFALLRSVLLPIKAILMNALSLTASYGALVLFFQEGRAAWLWASGARLRRGLAADHHVLRALRALDGLRGLPAARG